MKRFTVMLASLALALSMGAAPASAEPTPAPKGQSTVAEPKGGIQAPKGMPGIKGELNAKAASCGSPSVCFTYAGTNQFIGSAGQGADAVLVSTSQHKPYKDSADFHSLWELAAQNDGTTAPSGNIVEIGYTMDAAVCGAVFTAGNPCLFVFRWINGVPGSYCGGGWVDNPTESVNCGTALATTAGGASPTVFYEYKIEFASSAKCDNVTTDGTPVQTTATAGWLMYQQNVGSTRLIGCFPHTVWTAAGETFNKVHQVQAFDEIASSDDHTCTDMGSGIFAPAAFGTLSASQWVKAYTLTNPPAGVTADWGSSASVSPSFNTPTAFRIVKQTGGNEHRLGGPGFDVQGGTATGTAGNC